MDDADGRLFLGRGWGEAPQPAAPPVADPVAQGSTLDQALGIAGRQLWAILLPLIVIPGVMAVALSRMPLLYTASGTVIYDPAGYAPDVLQSIVKTDPTTDTVLASQAAILSSGAIAQRVAEALDLGRQPGFRPSPSLPAPVRPQAVDDAVKQAISVSAVDQSRVFTVSFTARDPAIAAAAVNRIQDLYLGDQLALKTAALQAADRWMQARADALNATLTRQDAAVAGYRAAHGLTQGVQARIATEQMSALGEELMRAQNDLAGADARQDATGGRAAGIAQNVVSMRLAQAQVQAQLDAARSRLGPNHPQVRALREQLATLQAATGTEIAAVHADVAGDADAAAARLASLRQSLLLLTAEGARDAAAEGPLAAMEQDAEVTRKLRQAVLAQMDQTAQQAAIQRPDARILSRAEPPLEPSSPRIDLLLGASLLAGLVTGLGLAWLRETGGLTFRTAAEVRSALALPVIGSLPTVRRRAGQDATAAMILDGSLAARQIDSLRARLRLTLGDPLILAVTASRPGEGKTTLALALARRTAMRGERVLLVDADGARANLSRRMRAEFVSNSAEGLRRDGVSGCAILPVGEAGGLSAQGLRGAMARDAWRRDFDLVILDLPPVLASADALTMADLADAVLFCLQWHRTPRRVAAYARDLLALPGGRPIAAVMTRLDPQARALRGFPEAAMAAKPYAAYARR
ncbi:GumC family protein [Acidisoma silvae]|uniref:Polysaccharide biosynthesis tyrosine autokinase n=1 Tax=Acidisoma silvae TaxID=2802396 RepID=A0A964E0I7_9PROT|nr:polysaccharide biosynthesis tyrosine autokinase [Acidisoma silvae]MCB8877202.1 polysaccharide biosynthesis tyrosine autokinase [Acidisoma silvae]